MPVRKSVPTHLVDVEIFHRISEKFDLLVALDGKSDHQSHYYSSSGDHEYLYQKFHGNPSDSCRDISVSNGPALPSQEPYR